MIRASWSAISESPFAIDFATIVNAWAPNEHAPPRAVFPVMMHRLCLVATAVFAAACHHQPPPKPPAPVAAAPAVAPRPAELPPAAAASPNIAVSDDLAKQCQLAVSSSEQAPKFDFDNFQLLPEDRDVLSKVATCLTTGPLKGKHVK